MRRQRTLQLGSQHCGLQHRTFFTLHLGSQQLGSQAGAQGAGAALAGSQHAGAHGSEHRGLHNRTFFTLQAGSQLGAHAGAHAAGAQTAGSQHAGAHVRWNRPASAEAPSSKIRAPAATSGRTTRRFMDTLLLAKTDGYRRSGRGLGSTPSIYNSYRRCPPVSFGQPAPPKYLPQLSRPVMPDLPCAPELPDLPATPRRPATVHGPGTGSFFAPFGLNNVPVPFRPERSPPSRVT